MIQFSGGVPELLAAWNLWYRSGLIADVLHWSEPQNVSLQSHNIHVLLTHWRASFTGRRGKSPKGMELRHTKISMSLKVFACCVHVCAHGISRTRTVVLECCKGHDASQRGNRKFDPLPRPNLLTDHHQKWHTWLGPGYIYRQAKFSHDPTRGFFFPYARNCSS